MTTDDGNAASEGHAGAAPGQNTDARAALQWIVATHGTSIAADLKRVEWLLGDLCRTRQRENRLLINAAREGVPAELLSPKAAMLPAELLLSRLTQHLEEHLLVTHTVARWAVESWALALGRITADELTTQQLNPPNAATPVKPIQPPVRPVVPLVPREPVIADEAEEDPSAPVVVPPILDSSIPMAPSGGWNWGAFFFSYIWLFAHGKRSLGVVYIVIPIVISALCTKIDIVNAYIADFVARMNHLSDFADDPPGAFLWTFIVYIPVWIACIPLAMTATRMAWQSGRFHDAKLFNAEQRKWNLWSPLGLILCPGLLCLWSYFWWKTFHIFI